MYVDLPAVWDCPVGSGRQAPPKGRKDVKIVQNNLSGEASSAARISLPGTPMLLRSLVLIVLAVLGVGTADSAEDRLLLNESTPIRIERGIRSGEGNEGIPGIVHNSV
jgi:hypothetical protein